MTDHDQREEIIGQFFASADQKTWLVVESEPQVAALRPLLKPNVTVSTWRAAITGHQFDRIVVLVSMYTGEKGEREAKYYWQHNSAMPRLTPGGSLMLVGGEL